VHAPDGAEKDELEQWVQKKLIWVHRKLALKEEIKPNSRTPQYVSGEMFFYLGRGYRLVLIDRQTTSLMFDGQRFTLCRDARERAEGEFRKWYIAIGTEWITRRARLLTRKTATAPSRIEVRDLGFRWGSCGQNNVLSFDWRLLQLPVRLVDYVICHELLHLRIPNHGNGFWALFDGVQPDWSERKTSLAAQAQLVHWLGRAQSCSRALIHSRSER
jgi:predicted metal-dependent hydrolase